MAKKADYIYRNASDTVRVRIFPQEVGGWDFDVAFKDSTFEFSCCSINAISYFKTKKEAKANAEERFGKLTPYNKIETLTQEW